jgi:lipopolysaccharide biosynthesis regulator YciM
MPYPSFVESAKCLDNKRLGKQRVEVLQILQALKSKNYRCTECGYEADFILGKECPRPPF